MSRIVRRFQPILSRSFPAVLGACLSVWLAALARPARAADDPVSHRAGSWLGVCDNLLDCAIFGFSDDDTATLILSEPHGRAASGTLLLRPPRPLHGQPVRLQADRRPAALTLHPGPEAEAGQVRVRLDEAALQALLPMLAAGGRLAVTLPSARSPARATPLAIIRLAGAAPVLDWTVRARRHMPLPSVAPLVAAGSTPRPLPATAPPAAVTSLAATRSCLTQSSEGPDGGVSGYALSAHLQLWQIPCGSGNFDRLSLFVLADTDAGTAAPASFATPPQIVPHPPGMLVNAEIGDDGLSLTATEPSRGLNDCGDLRRYRWDGTRFRLSLARLMAACHGLTPEDWPTIYRDTPSDPVE